MSLVITPQSQQQKQLAPIGLQPACCVDVFDRGVQSTKYGDQHQLSLIFELQATDSDGEHFILSRIVTRSLHPKSSLRKLCENWRGQSYSDEDLADGLDLNRLVGQPAMLHLKKNGDFIAIENILPPAEDRVFRGSGNYTRIKDR